ncbi:DUF4190 domain-containing protein [Demequina sediminicola]|uniref:DUF4190 domain-containing protein n=1 Tax=Demequina sediminicola TaxID=1095026 RepID=UPI000782B5F1|nr:DUF4190 domain-containing protein [Demequina sediminicola]
MTQNPTPPAPPAGAPQPAPEAPLDAAQKNTIGLVAMIVAIVAAIFACIPGALIVGWLLLPVGFILGIVALTRRGQKKGMGIAAVVISVVGTIVGIIVFVAVAAGAVNDALDDATGGDTTVVTEESAAAQEDTADADTADADEAEAEEEVAEAEEPSEPAGTRDNPYAFGETIQNDDWTITLTSLNTSANADVAAANQFNEEPTDGTVWITLGVEATYTGTDTGSTLGLGFDYVTPDGTVIGDHDALASGLEPEFDILAELYEGATEDGLTAFLVPDAVDGLLRVTPGIFADDVFFALPEA